VVTNVSSSIKLRSDLAAHKYIPISAKLNQAVRYLHTRLCPLPDNSGHSWILARDSLSADDQSGWRQFVSCVEALPPNEAMPLWQQAQAQAAGMMTETAQ
jgi:hypothetical protein